MGNDNQTIGGMRTAFTLIELLVVIAVVAILAACLFPVFAQAKEASKKAACLSNGKQLTLGIIMYSGDCDDVLPLVSFDEQYGDAHPFGGAPYLAGGKYQTLLPDVIMRYIKTTGAFICPTTSFRLNPDWQGQKYIAAGSYAYFCAHSHGLSISESTSPLAVFLSLYGPGAASSGVGETLARAEAFFACGNSMSRAIDVASTPVIMCDGFVHGEAGLQWEESFLPPELGGRRNDKKSAGTTFGYLDGHAQRKTGNFDDHLTFMHLKTEAFQEESK